jgi:hypothetical protein
MTLTIDLEARGNQKITTFNSNFAFGLVADPLNCQSVPVKPDADQAHATVATSARRVEFNPRGILYNCTINKTG